MLANMKTREVKGGVITAARTGLLVAGLSALVAFWGCENNSDSPPDFGDNDPNTVVCVGDSITKGIENDGYVPELAALSGKSVIKSAIGGSLASSGVSRTPGLLARYKPGYLVIEYGANDVIHGIPHATTIEDLRAMVQMAKGNMTVPIVCTLTPMVRQHVLLAGEVDSINILIRQMASEEGARVADVNQAFNATGKDLLQFDGLHPTEEGNAVYAATVNGRLD